MASLSPQKKKNHLALYSSKNIWNQILQRKSPQQDPQQNLQTKEKISWLPLDLALPRDRLGACPGKQISEFGNNLLFFLKISQL